MDFLQRDQAPLTDEQWETIDRVVTEVGRRNLVGRRFISIFGPVGPGVQAVADDVLTGVQMGVVDFLGEEESDAIGTGQRRFIPLPTIHKDFRVHWRDLETSRQLGSSLEISNAAAAAAFCARAEDDLIFNGNTALDQQGLLTVPGRQTLTRSDWSVSGNAFNDVVAATEKLVAAGFYGPYAMAVSPRLYAQMHRVYANTGVLEIEQIQKLLTAGVYQSPVLHDESAVIVSHGAENLDIVIAQDLITAYLEARSMNHYFRVFEILALRIKRPGAVLTFEGS